MPICYIPQNVSSDLIKRPALVAVVLALSGRSQLGSEKAFPLFCCVGSRRRRDSPKALTLMAPACQGDESFEEHVDALVQSRTDAEVHLTWSFTIFSKNKAKPPWVTMCRSVCWLEGLATMVGIQFFYGCQPLM